MTTAKSGLRAGSPTQQAGRLAEDAALTLLQAHGHELVARNFYCRRGEIDLITLHGQWLVFTEVRWRSRTATRTSSARAGATGSGNGFRLTGMPLLVVPATTLARSRGAKNHFICDTAAKFTRPHRTRALSIPTCRFQPIGRQTIAARTRFASSGFRSSSSVRALKPRSACRLT